MAKNAVVMPMKMTARKASNNDCHPDVTAVERGFQDGEFAQEQSEWRCAGDGQKTCHPKQPGRRRGRQQAAHLGDVFGLVTGQDVPGKQEQHGFGERMIHGVQHRAERARAAQSDAQCEDAHVSRRWSRPATVCNPSGPE